MAGSVTSATGSSNVENVDNLDRISNLPEHLLSQILSLLPTKEAVASSILSKRWIFLWTTITAIDISFNGERCSPTFLDFVMNRVLLQRNQPSIHKFSLSVSDFTDDSLINTWVSALGRRQVKHIKLEIANYFEREYCIVMPCRSSLFDCKKLEVLILSGSGILFNISKEVSICFLTLKVLHLEDVTCGEISTEEEGSTSIFPVLQTLYLVYVTYMENDDPVKKLLKQCRVLEVVQIKHCEFNLANIQICAPVLRRLELDFRPLIHDYKVEIDAPALQYVTIIGLTEKLLFKQIPYSLVDAKMVACGFTLDNDIKKQSLSQFREVIIPVDRSKYQAYINAIIGSTNRDHPLFSNLKRLEVSLWCDDVSVSYLQCFLERSVNLQYLVIEKASCGFLNSEQGKCGYEEPDLTPCGTGQKLGWNEYFNVPTCLISSLKGLEIDVFYGCSHEVAMIKYMLKNAKVLEKVSLICWDNGEKTSELLQKISMFPRGSAVCEVKFYLW